MSVSMYTCLYVSVCVNKLRAPTQHILINLVRVTQSVGIENRSTVSPTYHMKKNYIPPLRISHYPSATVLI